MMDQNAKDETCIVGIPGLDEIIQGGLPRNRLYVLQGEPGSGKTTLALQFLLEGVRLGESSLYISFSETKEELNAVARSHGWDISKINLVDLSSLESKFNAEGHTTLFHPSEIELTRVTEGLLKRIDEISPSRIVFDSISEMRLLAESPLRYRRQILILKQALSGKKMTVFFLDDLTSAAQDLQVQSIAHGVFSLTRLHHEFGGERRRIRILKLRGVNFIGGYHDFEIATGGVRVFPRLIPSKFREGASAGQLPSGIKQLDTLLGGGLDDGTANLFIGPPGTGKSTLVLIYALSAVSRGEKVAFFCFDETVANLLKRSRSLGLKVEEAVRSGALRLQKVDPAELSPGALAHHILELAHREKIKVVVIDSLNGYIQAMPQEQFLALQLHELLAFLNNQGLITIMTLAQQGLIGQMQAPVDLTYLADTVILTRFFEAGGEVRKAVSIIKKRTGMHESTIREFMIGKNGVEVGPVLKDFQGVLTGVPRFAGDINTIMKNQNDR